MGQQETKKNPRSACKNNYKSNTCLIYEGTACVSLQSHSFHPRTETTYVLSLLS